MTQEIELKLSLSKQSADDFSSLDILAGLKAETFDLENTYYDTEDFALSKASAALRTRKLHDGRYLQTLKTRGSNISGLHRRHEWEMPITSNQLELALFPEQSLPAGVDADALQAIFTTHFTRRCWNVEQGNSVIELVLDSGWVDAQGQREAILELELELKSGNVSDLFGLALQISREVAVMPSDVSKAERGFRLCGRDFSASPELPLVDAEQTIGETFVQLFNFELQKLHQQWQLFWQTQQWRYLQSYLVTVGNMSTELDWFKQMIPTSHVQFVASQLDWLEQQIRPILSWWPACFALSQDAEQDSQGAAFMLQRENAKKAMTALDALVNNPELGFRLLSLSAWLHKADWQQDQTDEHRRLSDQSIRQGVNSCLKHALLELNTDNFAGNASYALSQTSVVHKLLILCQYFERLYGNELSDLKEHLRGLEESLAQLSAMGAVSQLQDWVHRLPMEKQASVHSWARSQTVILREIKQLAAGLAKPPLVHYGEPA